jgi:hypothetical protein
MEGMSENAGFPEREAQEKEKGAGWMLIAGFRNGAGAPA